MNATTNRATSGMPPNSKSIDVLRIRRVAADKKLASI
jgi:hypothetical protein